MGLYRDAPDRVNYGPWFIPVTFDAYEAGILAAFLVLLGVQLVMLPFMRCTRNNIISQLAITWSIFTGYVIVCMLPCGFVMCCVGRQSRRPGVGNSRRKKSNADRKTPQSSVTGNGKSSICGIKRSPAQRRKWQAERRKETPQL